MPLLNNDKFLKFLKGLDIINSTETDDAGPILLRMAASFIADSLTYVCNLNIMTCTFPNKWKEAKVKPLNKAAPTHELNNFMPIVLFIAYFF